MCDMNNNYFAWYPVYVRDNGYVWLSYVKRVWNPEHDYRVIDPYDLGDYVGGWEYYKIDRSLPMSGDSERDAPYQHPTERERYLDWRGNVPLEYDDSELWRSWKACAKLKDKEIEQLKARLHEVSTDWQVNQAKLAQKKRSEG